MNNSVPGWDFESDSNQKKPMELDQELVELLWQNGQVVLNSQTHKKPIANPIKSRHVQRNFQSTLRTSEPFQNSSNLIQDDETVSWIQYPVEDQFEQELCSNLLSELPPCETQSYSQIRQFEEGKFFKLEASRNSDINSNSQSSHIKPHSFVQEFTEAPMPAPRFHASESSQKIHGLEGSESHKVLNFSHFSTPPNANFRGKGASNPWTSEVRECSGMTVGSSYCGSNHISQEQDVSKPSSNGAWAATLSVDPEALRDDVHRTVPQSDKGKSEMLEPNISSSSGVSESSLGKTCSLCTRNHGQKREYIDAEESEEQSESTGLKAGVGNKASKRPVSYRRNRAAEVHNLSERRRRDRISEKMRALQQLIPHSTKTDKASMLEAAIEYLKSLQLQLQVMWMGSGMAPMFPGVQHYMSQMSMGMATPSFPPIQNAMQLPRVPLDQSLPVSHTPNQTLMCQNPILGAFSYQNQMQNPALSEQYARYMGYHPMQNSPQPMNAFRYGSQATMQHSQTMVPPSNSSGPMSRGGAANIDDVVSSKKG